MRRKVGPADQFLAEPGLRAAFEGETQHVGSLAALICGAAAMRGEDPTRELFEAGFVGRATARANAPKPAVMKDVLTEWFGEHTNTKESRDVLREWMGSEE